MWLISTLLLVLIVAPVFVVMAYKARRTVQEWQARRGGYITFGGDDCYQAKNLHLDKHIAVMIARIELDMDDAALDEVIERIERNYLAWYRRLEQSIQKPSGTVFQEPLEIRDHAEPVEIGEQPLLARIVIHRDERTIHLLGNHIYLGGYLLSQFVQVVFCASIHRDVFPRNRYIPLVTEAMVLAFFVVYVVRGRVIPTRVFEDKGDIRRFYLNRELAVVQALSDELRMHSLYVVIAQHVDIVLRHTSLDRVRVTLPVSFSDESSFNTVGGMFLDIDREGSFEALARQIRTKVKRARWQVSATNHIQRIFPTRRMSENARNLVDLTLTVVPGKTLPENLLTDEIRSYEFTMDSIDYPVYVMAFIFEDRVHSSFMVNTPDFDLAAFEREDGAVPMDLQIRRAS